MGRAELQGKLESPGFHGADHLNGPLLVLFPGKADIAFLLKGLKIGDHRVIRTEAEVGTDFVKTGRDPPLFYVAGNISQEVLLFVR